MVLCITAGIGGFFHLKSLQDKRLQCSCVRPPLGLSSLRKPACATRFNEVARRKPSRSSLIVSAVSEPKEEHKIFDEVVMVVRAGNGGSGEIVCEGKGKMVKNLKYQKGRQLKKNIWLNASPPAPGVSGADVIIQCSSHVDSLVHLHGKELYTASSGANGNPEEGSQAPKRMRRVEKSAPPLKIQVPPGTVVKRRSGRFIGEVLDFGEELLVARGGKGGLGVVQPSKRSKGFRKKKVNKLRASGVDVIEIVDENWKVDSFGSPGEEVALHLLLRIVADAGFVGLPNAGKSSLLASLTRARPEIAAYPFTTLIPNLGVMGKGGDPVLVDLPGLIEGAHVGKGLGRKFLQHLRRTRALLQVVDASSPDPIADFITIREELRMYNPDYCVRPFVVALNKMDLDEASCRKDELISGIHDAADGLQKTVEGAVLPSAVVPVSALEDSGVAELRMRIDDMVAKTDGEFKDVSELLKATDEGLEELADLDQESSWE